MSASPFNPEQYLQLADEIVQARPDETGYRAGVGRAYYASFLVARAKRPIDGRERVHKRVRDNYSKDRATDGIASRLGCMERLRDVADYQVVPDNSGDRDWKKNWDQVRRSASYVIDAVKKMP